MGKTKRSKNPEETAARKAAQHQVNLNRFRLQEPINLSLQENGFIRQEIKNLWHRCAALLYEHPSLVPVRFCPPNYPKEWLWLESQVQPYADFINDSFRGQPHLNKPVNINPHGGYVLILMEEAVSAEFVRSLLPGLRVAVGSEIREPTREQIDVFHVTWEERSPKMFGRNGRRRK